MTNQPTQSQKAVHSLWLLRIVRHDGQLQVVVSTHIDGTRKSFLTLADAFNYIVANDHVAVDSVNPHPNDPWVAPSP